jgi:hypothetical protein
MTAATSGNRPRGRLLVLRIGAAVAAAAAAVVLAFQIPGLWPGGGRPTDVVDTRPPSVQVGSDSIAAGVEPGGLAPTERLLRPVPAGDAALVRDAQEIPLATPLPARTRAGRSQLASYSGGLPPIR